MTPLPPTFWAKTERAGDHLLWVGALSGGYGLFKHDGKIQGAHRLAYVEAKGPIPDGMQIDHLCRVPSCVEASHLEAVTPGENQARSEYTSKGKAECAKGHPLTDENVWIGKAAKSQRRCRKCKSETYARWKSKRVAADAATVVRVPKAASA